MLKMFMLIAALALILIFGSMMLSGGSINFEPGVIIDKTVTPSSHALYGITSLPAGNGTYCLHAETLSRGQPVNIGFHYRIPQQVTADRFGSTEYKQEGAVFVTDNNRVVNETIVVPEGAIDTIVTVSYSYYISDNKVHLIVKRC